MQKNIMGPPSDRRSLYRIGSVRTMGAPVRGSSGATITIADTSTPALVGDIFRAEIGNLQYLEIPVVSVTTNTFDIASQTLPTNADTFYLLRKVSPRAASDGTAAASAVTISTPTALTVKQAALAVGLTAVRLTNDGAAPVSTRVLLMANTEQTTTAKFYVGSSTVTNSGATRGVVLNGGEPFFRANDAGDYYIISDTAAQTVYVLEQE